MRAMLTKVNKTLSKQSKNNKGFSLIELIIVIAIMAALIAILAPQYLKYVEKSRDAADQAQASTILNACQTAAADTDISWADDSTGTTATWDGTNLTIAGNNKGVLETALTTSLSKTFSASDVATVEKMKSNAHQSKKYVITIKVASGVPTVSVTTNFA